jgi:hypothetical protein
MFHVSLYSIYSVTNKASHSLGVANALAFDANRLSTVNTVDLITKVIKSTIIHGFEFSKALQEVLRQCPALGRHTNVYHFAPPSIIKYLWAHKEYQPYGVPCPVQCPQCGILKPWVIIRAKTPQSDGYNLECRNGRCGMVGNMRVKLPYGFRARRPPGSTLLSTAKDGGWLQLTPS